MIQRTSIAVAPLVARFAHAFAGDVVACAVLAATTQSLAVGAKCALLTPYRTHDERGLSWLTRLTWRWIFSVKTRTCIPIYTFFYKYAAFWLQWLNSESIVDILWCNWQTTEMAILCCDCVIYRNVSAAIGLTWFTKMAGTLHAAQIINCISCIAYLWPNKHQHFLPQHIIFHWSLVSNGYENPDL